MGVILVPGLWLDASSWDAVLSSLSEAGHRPHPLTMPGLGFPVTESSGIGIADWVAAVVTEIDASEGPVVLVGHSGGGNVVWGAADARPDRVRRVVFIDTVPPPNGSVISDFPDVDGVVPFPGWDFFDAEDVADLDEETRDRTAPLMRSVPALVPTDSLLLVDPRRYGIPVTLLLGSLNGEELEGMLDEWGEHAEEYRAIRHTNVARIGSGHWPQFSTPDTLARLLVEAIGR